MLLEPVMEVEVVTPQEFMGEVIGDLNARRGKILDMENRAGAQVIEARVPLATMFGYATRLRSMTQGRATYTMQFGAYEPVPQNIFRGIDGAQRRRAASRARAPRTQAQGGSHRRVQHMGKAKFERNKPHANVGTIGHIDHGKTTLDRGDHQGAGVEEARHSSSPSIRSTRRPKSASAASRSRSRTSSTRPPSATTRTSIARATPTISRT